MWTGIWRKNRSRYQLEVDREKAALHGISVAQITQTLQMALSGQQVGLLHQPKENEDVPIVLRLPLKSRAGIERLNAIKINAPNGSQIPLSTLIHSRRTEPDQSIYHKNLMPVVYVTGDVAGAKESPIYAILELRKKIEPMTLPEGYQHPSAYGRFT